MIRTSTALWRGDGLHGKGELSTQSGVFKGQPYSFQTRFQSEDGKAGTNPEELLGAAFELDISEHVVPQIAASGEAMWDLMSTAYGPTKVLASSLDPERRESLHREFAAFFEGYRDGDQVCLPRTYLQVIGQRRG